jgi:hypothetical protein
MSAPGGPGFDQWLDSQLQQHASANPGPSPVPAQSQYHAAYLQGGAHLSLLAKIAAALTTKAAIGVAAGALVVAAAGAGESVVTGSFNPSDWGKQVVEQVNDCKTALTPGSHGIGDCVSSFASQHAQAASAQHRATPTPGHGDRTPGPPTGKGKPVTPTAHPHPTPPAQAHPTPPAKKK